MFLASDTCSILLCIIRPQSQGCLADLWTIWLTSIIHRINVSFCSPYSSVIFPYHGSLLKTVVEKFLVENNLLEGSCKPTKLCCPFLHWFLHLYSWSISTYILHLIYKKFSLKQRWYIWSQVGIWTTQPSYTLASCPIWW